MTPLFLKDKSCAVIGLARTGTAVARFCLAKGAKVTVLELAPDAGMEAAVAALVDAGATVIVGSQAEELPDGIDLVIPSPGVRPAAPVLRSARVRGVEIMSELELAGRFTDRPLIVVTGTNGKTTTVTLIGEILAAAGMTPEVAGNIGRPLIDCIDGSARGPLVVEASSFQLEYTSEFSPRVAILLNITPDHLDWHQNLDAYRQAKMKIFAAQGPEDSAVVPIGLAPDLGALKATTVVIGGSKGVFIEDGWICQDLTAAGHKVVEVDKIQLPGAHNIENVMAAAAAALVFDVAPERIAEVVRGFTGVEHRLEFVAEEGGIRFYNDSKATNPASSIKGLEAFDADIVWLAGGRNKGNDFTRLAQAAAARARSAVLFGEAASEIGAALAVSQVPFVSVATFEEAVEAGRRQARPGDVVLLSPACASFDMFTDYEERGRRFKSLVAQRVQSVG